MCSYSRCTKTDISTRRCSKCLVVSYCDESCQRADFKIHRTYCQAASEARSCPMCQTLPEQTRALHADNLPSGYAWGELMERIPEWTSNVPNEIVLLPVYHAPFSPTAWDIIQSMHRPDLCRPPGAHIDSIIVSTQQHQVYFGQWAADFTRKKLQRIFSGETVGDASSSECWVCIETNPDQVACRECSARVCTKCWAKMVSEADGPVPCPGCRTASRI